MWEWGVGLASFSPVSITCKYVLRAGGEPRLGTFVFSSNQYTCSTLLVKNSLFLVIVWCIMCCVSYTVLLCIVRCTVVYRTLYCCVSHAVLLCIVRCTVVYRTLYCCVSCLCVLGSLANGRQLFLATKILVCVQQHFLEQHSFITLVVLHCGMQPLFVPCSLSNPEYFSKF